MLVSGQATYCPLAFSPGIVLYVFAATSCYACSFVWALVHSPDPAHVERGLDLAQSMIKSRDIDQQHLNDLVYMCAVVSFLYGDVYLHQLKATLIHRMFRGLVTIYPALHRLSIEGEAIKLPKSKLLNISR